MRNKYLCTAFALFVSVIGSESLFAQEAARESSPIEGDADQLSLPSTAALEPEVVPEHGPLHDFWQEVPPFFKDMTAKVNIRNFYYAQQAGADAPGNDKEKISWALGGSLQVKSGKIYDVFNVGAEVFTSQRLYGPKDKDGARLLETGQEGYTVLGVLNPRFEYEGHLISTFRQRLDLPYVNNQENRMTPNTFENYSYAYLGKGDSPVFQLGTGYLQGIKQRNSDNFVSMSEAAGVVGHDRGMPWLGLRLRPIKDVKIVGIDYVGIDFLNIFYSDAEYSMKVSEDLSLKSSVQFSTQESIGDDYLTGKDVSVAMWGLQQAVSYRKFMVRAALTVNDSGTSLRNPFGSYPGYNSSIVEDFNRAGEIAWKVGLSYDFVALGLDGLSAYTDYIQGSGAVDDNKQDLNDKNETDINIDYRVKQGWLKNFWLRLRGGFVQEDNVGTTKDYRVILNYDIPLA